MEANAEYPDQEHQNIPDAKPKPSQTLEMALELAVKKGDVEFAAEMAIRHSTQQRADVLAYINKEWVYSIGSNYELDWEELLDKYLLWLNEQGINYPETASSESIIEQVRQADIQSAKELGNLALSETELNTTMHPWIEEDFMETQAQIISPRANGSAAFMKAIKELKSGNLEDMKREIEEDPMGQMKFLKQQINPYLYLKAEGYYLAGEHRKAMDVIQYATSNDINTATNKEVGSSMHRSLDKLLFSQANDLMIEGGPENIVMAQKLISDFASPAYKQAMLKQLGF